MDFERKERAAEHGAIDKTIRQEPSHTNETRALTAQCKFNPEPKKPQKKAPDSEPVRPNLTGMPDRLKSNLESMSGFDMSSVRVHYNSPEPEKVGALAYAQGTNIHLGRGQEKYLPHEGWHIAQQMQGRVSATTQYKNIYINDDPQLEKEADVMGERALTRSVSINGKNNNPPLTTQTNQTQNSPITQRVIKYKGVIYDNKNHNIFKLKEEFNEVMKILGVGMGKIMGYQTDESNIYIIDHDNQTFTKEAYDKSDRILTLEELLNIRAEQNTTEFIPPVREDHYPEKSTLYAPLDKAIIAINHDSSESDLNYIGTSGLSGCVEVIIECHTETDDGYLVSHVFSNHAGKIPLLRDMLNLMLTELNHDLSSDISWEDFSKENSSACKITLVRNKYIGSSNNREEDQLFIDMRNILTDFGAHIHAIASSSVSIQITPEGAIYFNNNNPDKRIDLDYRKNDDYYFEEDRV